MLNSTLRDIQRPGAFTLKNVILKTPSGIKLNITDSVTSFNLYSSIYTPFVTGSIIFSDSNNLSEFLPLMGEETLTYQLYTPGYDIIDDINTENFSMKVTRIINLKVSEFVQQFLLEFASSEFKRNNRVRSVSPLRGTHSDMVSQILKSDIKTSKNIAIEPTQENFKLVSPNIPPISMIQKIAKRSTSSKFNETGYFFYEDFFNTFHFRTFASMVNQIPGVVRQPTIRYHVQPAVNTDLDIQMTRVKTFELKRAYDHTDNTRSGMYANKLIVHNTDAKSYKEYDFRYDTFFNKSYHTDVKKNRMNKIAYDGVVDEYGNKLYDFSSSKICAIVNGGDRVYNEGDNYPYKSPNLQTTIQQRISREQSLKNIVLNLTVHGLTALNLGQVIEFVHPKMSTDSDHNNRSRLYSGRYVITKLRHSISIGGTSIHETLIECVKDSLSNSVNSSNNITQNIQRSKGTTKI